MNVCAQLRMPLTYEYSHILKQLTNSQVSEDSFTFRAYYKI